MPNIFKGPLFPPSRARRTPDITEIAIDECKEVTEEDYERVREWAEK